MPKSCEKIKYKFWALFIIIFYVISLARGKINIVFYIN